MLTKKMVGIGATMLVLAGSITLLQLHGIAFWQDKVGTNGWAWSILLEAAALWLWYQPKFLFRALALVASMLTLAGPVYQVAKPTFIAAYETIDSTMQRDVSLSILAAEKKRLEGQVIIYQENSSKRTGWLEPIERANARLAEIDTEIINLQRSTEHKSQWFFSWAILMEIVSLVLFQIVAILSITSLGRKMRESESLNNAPNGNAFHDKEIPVAVNFHNGKTEENSLETALKSISCQKDEAAPEIVVSTQNDGDTSIDGNAETTESALIDPYFILDKLEQFIKERSMSFKDFSIEYGVSSKELSFLRNHKKRVEDGERTVSAPALEKIKSIVIQ